MNLTLSVSALLASPTATLTGRVTNTTGVIMAYVQVQAINVETGVKLATSTNEEGLYSIANIPPGIYRLMLQKHGFRTVIKPGIELRVQDIFALNFEMQIGSAAESVTEQEGAPLLQAETAMLGQTIDRKLLSELPTLTRSPHDFVGLSAGAVAATPNELIAHGHSGTGVGFSINGQRPESVNFLLDGGDSNSNPATTGPGQIVPHEAVREYRILTNNFTAEYGRNFGFIADLVTKSGSNEIHGSIYDYVRNSGLAANTFDNNAYKPRGIGAPSNIPRPVFNRHQGGGSLGGPIFSDKAFFFGSFESIFVRSSGFRNFLVPTPELLAISSPTTQAIFSRYPLPGNSSNTGSTRLVQPFEGGPPVRIPVSALVPFTGPADLGRAYGLGPPQNTYLGLARIDYTLGTRTLLTGRYALQDVNQLAIRRQPYAPELDPPDLAQNHNATVNVTRTWSATMISESRLAFSRLSTTRPETFSDVFFRGGVGDPSGGLPTGLPPKGGPRNLYQLHQTASWVHGNHDFKFGGDVVHYRDAIHAPLYQAYWSPGYDPQGFVNGRIRNATFPFDFLANAIKPAARVDGRELSANRVSHLRYNDIAWFFQDTWKVTRRLTLTPGLRWEYFGVQSSPGHERVRDVNFYPGEGATYYERFANGRFLRTIDAPGEYRNHYTRPDRNNFGPRLGLALDLDGKGTTIFRAGAGIFFDATYGRVPPTMIGSVTFFDVPFSPEDPNNPYAINGQGVSEPPWVERVDPDRRIPTAGGWNATIERELGGKLALSGSYVGSSGSGLELVALENGKGSGRHLGRPGERLLNDYDLFLTVKGLAHSSYHSFQLRAESRPIHRLGLQFGANYTWGHSLDNASDRFIDQERDQFLGYQFLPGAHVLLDQSNPQLDRGNSSFDQKHRLVTHFIFEIPGLQSTSAFAKHLTAGWQVSGILSFQTGQPILVVDGSAPDDSYYVTRPRVTGPLPRVFKPNEMIPDPVLPNSFVYLPVNDLRDLSGNCIPEATPFACVASINDPLDHLLARNHYRSPGSHFQDLAFTKSVRVREQVRVQIRAEFYNLFNHANLESAGRGQANMVSPRDLALPPSFTISSGVRVHYGGPPRQVMLAVRITF